MTSRTAFKVLSHAPTAGGVAEILARAELPTRHGEFQIVSFRKASGLPSDHVALCRGAIAGKERVLTRMHSECLTGDALGSIRCDCRDQLEASLERLGQRDCGVLLYLRQEGRGIGIGNKVRAYQLQDSGLDTVEANVSLGFEDDLRSYVEAAAMLRLLDVASVVLQTNNPRKIQGLRNEGIVTVREALVASSRPENRHYLETKRAKSGHLL